MAIPGEDKNDKAVPDTTQKKDGTTSAFSAASTSEKREGEGNSNQSTYGEGGQQGRASFYPGSTTQGGSNYGQGSSHLGPSSYKQGSERNKGANYENETGKFAETGTEAEGNHPEKEGGTDNEHDEISDREERQKNNEETLGIP
jgi:hypothetical protein